MLSTLLKAESVTGPRQKSQNDAAAAAELVKDEFSTFITRRMKTFPDDDVFRTDLDFDKNQTCS